MSLNYDIMRLVGVSVKAKRVFAEVLEDLSIGVETVGLEGMTRNTEDDDNFGGQEGGRWWEEQGAEETIDPRSCYLARTLMKVKDTPDHLTNYSFQVELVESWNLMSRNIFGMGTHGRINENTDYICHKTLIFPHPDGNEDLEFRFSAWGSYCF